MTANAKGYHPLERDQCDEPEPTKGSSDEALLPRSTTAMAEPEPAAEVEPEPAAEAEPELAAEAEPAPAAEAVPPRSAGFDALRSAVEEKQGGAGRARARLAEAERRFEDEDTAEAMGGVDRAEDDLLEEWRLMMGSCTLACAGADEYRRSLGDELDAVRQLGALQRKASRLSWCCCCLACCCSDPCGAEAQAEELEESIRRRFSAVREGAAVEDERRSIEQVQAEHSQLYHDTFREAWEQTAESLLRNSVGKEDLQERLAPLKPQIAHAKKTRNEGQLAELRAEQTNMTAQLRLQRQRVDFLETERREMKQRFDDAKHCDTGRPDGATLEKYDAEVALRVATDLRKAEAEIAALLRPQSRPEPELEPEPEPEPGPNP